MKEAIILDGWVAGVRNKETRLGSWVLEGAVGLCRRRAHLCTCPPNPKGLRGGLNWVPSHTLSVV